MKTDPHATATAHGFQNVKEVEAFAKDRMEKALSAFQHDIVQHLHWPCLHQSSR